jgi:two-component system, NtrC family, sensor kinase
MESNPRLLIVDDNEAIHEDFRKVLGPRPGTSGHLDAAEDALFGSRPARETSPINSFELDSAYQGEEGLELVNRAIDTGRPYAMAFMDVRMPPGWDGVETTAKIWKIDPDLQVVICTAFTDCSWEEMLLKLGRSDRLVILKKPFDHIEVLQLANSLTMKWQLLQESKRQRSELEQMVAARTRQLVQEQEKLRAIFENSPDGIFQSAADGRVLNANPALAAMFGHASVQELMEHLRDAHGQLHADPRQSAELRRRIEAEGIVRVFESEIKCKDGSKKLISQTACKVTDPDGALRYYQGFVRDITAQKAAEQERNLMEVQLRQAQKLESVGQLASGIAHEINTPIQYIGDNIRFIESSFTDLLELLAREQNLNEAIQANRPTEKLRGAVEVVRRKTDVAYLSTEIPSAIQQSLDGVNRVSKIVSAMKEFSHPGATEKTPTDLNHAIQTAVTVARNEWKYVADVVTEFDPKLPPVPCLPGEFNQVILNLIVNAAHAIGDVVMNTQATRGKIKITTRLDDLWVEIRIADTGTGVPEKIRHRLFEPFFTTKPVGKGTGQGLAIARSTIVTKHGGQLTFESTVGQGTTFIIRLPVNPAPAAPTKPIEAGYETHFIRR